jgi:spermidine/putrescine transport system substrate-binding protein
MKPLPQDPQIAQLVSMMSRRRVLQAGALAGVGAVVAACGGGIGGGTASPSATTVEDLSDTEKFFNWSTWIDYIDVDDAGNRPTLDRFKKETGITVNYTEDYNDNNEFYAKVRAQLEAGQSIERDLVTPTDWMSAIWIAKGYAAKLDKANIPNIGNIGAAWQGVGADPDHTYSVPWQSGYGGLGWNKKALKQLTGKTELKSLDELWDPRLKGRVIILSELRETMGCMLQAMGKDATNFTDTDFENAITEYQKQIDSGQIRSVMGNDYKTSMASGEVVAGIAWSGDMLNDPETYGFAIPEAGGTMFTDMLLIPVLASHKKNAERWINFYYDPEVAATVAAYVNYITPVAGAQEAMQKIDPALVDNQAIFPTDATRARAKVFMTLDDDQRTKYESQFAALTGA